MVINKKTLKNKLKLLTVTDKDSQSVSIMILVRVGSRFEDKKQNGIAHFVEHTFFKGTKKRPSSKQIGMEIENLGGSSNTFTSSDYTGYYIKVPKEKFKKSAEILADMIKNSLFDKKEIDKERGVIVEEIRMYEDTPQRKAPDVFDENLFGDHPLGKLTTGTVQSVSSMPRQAFLDFVKNYYVGENMMVVTAGGIEWEEARDEMESLFGSIPKGDFAKYEKYEERKVNSEVHITEKKIEQTHLVIGGFGLNRKSKDRFIYQVGKAVLSDGFGSRLFQVIRDELGLAYYVYSYLHMMDEIGAYMVGVGVDNKRAEKAVEAVLEQLKQLSIGKFDDDELERAQNYLVGGLVTGLESSDEVASWHGIQDLLIGEVLSVEQVKKEILSVNRDDIVRVWGKLIRDDNIMLAGISPRSDLEKISLGF